MKRSDLSDYFYFVRDQRAAVVLLFLLSAVLLVLPSFYKYIIPEPPPTDFTETKIAAAAIIEKTEQREEKRKEKYFSKEFESYSKSDYRVKNIRKKSNHNTLSPKSLFPFDPNKAPKEQLLEFGFSEKVASTIIKWRNKGGFFYKKEDVRKIYGITNSDYEIIEPYLKIKLPQKKNIFKEKTSSVPTKEKAPPVISVDINQASEEEWQQLRGIGPYYAQKIVRFRQALGGFSSIEQIGTTYGLKDSTFQIIKPFLKLSPIPKKIKINTATEEELTNHPYIRKKQAEVLLKYRKNHGLISSFEDFKKVGIFDSKDLDKLLPYLDFATD